jgi:hypothetical protein
MPQVGFEPTIPVFERAKTVHASDRAATVIGIVFLSSINRLGFVMETGCVSCEMGLIVFHIN